MHVQVKLTAHTLGQRLAMGNNQAVRVAMIMMATGLVALAALVASDLGSGCILACVATPEKGSGSVATPKRGTGSE